MPRAPKWFPAWRFLPVRATTYLIVSFLVFIVGCYALSAIVGQERAVQLGAAALEYGFYFCIVVACTVAALSSLWNAVRRK